MAGPISTKRQASDYLKRSSQKLALPCRDPPQFKPSPCVRRGVLQDSKLEPLRRWQCHLGYLFTFGTHRLEKRTAAQETGAARAHGTVRVAD
jgi:hypothetical protein